MAPCTTESSLGESVTSQGLVASAPDKGAFWTLIPGELPGARVVLILLELQGTGQPHGHRGLAGRRTGKGTEPQVTGASQPSSRVCCPLVSSAHCSLWGQGGGHRAPLPSCIVFPFLKVKYLFKKHLYPTKCQTMGNQQGGCCLLSPHEALGTF